jgi:hypothetical protein
MSVMAAITISARPEVVEKINMYNLATLQQDADAMEKRLEQQALLPAQLDLTDEQVQEIVAGTAIFKSLRSSILQELQQLQAEVLASTGPHDDSCGSDSSAGSANLGNGSSSSSTPELSLHAILGDIDQHMRHTDRIQVLLHKEMTVRAAAVAWLMDCLDWRQITKGAILCWPYPWRVSAFGPAVTRYAEGQEMGQEQGHEHSSSRSRSGSG